MKTRLLEAVTRFEEGFLSIMLLQMGLSVFLQVVVRFLFSSAITWLDEFVHYEVVLLTFFGAGLGVKYGVHICVDVLKNRFQGTSYHVLEAMNHLMVLVYVAVILYFGMALISMMTGRSNPTPTLHIPKHYLYFLVWLGYVVIGLRTAGQLYGSLCKVFRRGQQRSI